MKHFIILFTLFIHTSCAYKNTTQDIEKHKSALHQDAFTYEGSYQWSFQLMGSNQVSTQSFYADSILYNMEGKVYNTNYTIRKLSFNAVENKWIGESPDHVIYVMFFKDKTAHSISIYKHKCKSNGLEEALLFERPNDDATSDHGWNTYALDGHETKDLLPLSGTFTSINGNISISDKFILLDDKKVEKMSFHTGERRWVGKYEGQYLQVFFEDPNNLDAPHLSIQWFIDLETAYKTKYNSIKSENWNAYERI